MQKKHFQKGLGPQWTASLVEIPICELIIKINLQRNIYTIRQKRRQQTEAKNFQKSNVDEVKVILAPKINSRMH